MQLSALAGNARVKERLSQRERGLSHAYLISGPTGSGKHTLAQSLCAAMVCQSGGERPCGSCTPCKKVFGGIHPDVVTISGEGSKPISVDQVRALRADAYIRPNEGERKIYVLEQAGQMNASAQNAMLKLLEEGPVYAAFLLLCEQESQLLVTIRSRCEELAMAPVALAECEQWLAQHYSQAEEPARRQAALDCQGILGRAVEQMEGGGEKRQAMLEQAQEIVRTIEAGSELELFECVMALEKVTKEDLPVLLDTLDAELVAYLPRSRDQRRMLRAVELVRKLRGAAALNVNPGQLSGWLCAGMYQSNG